MLYLKTAAAGFVLTIVALYITVHRMNLDPTKATGVGALIAAALFSPVFWLVTFGGTAISYWLFRR